MSRLWIDIRNFVDFVLLLLRRFALLTGCLLNLHGTAIAQETPSSTNEPLQELTRQLGSHQPDHKPQSPHGTIPRVGDLPQVKASDHPGILSGGDPGEVLQESVDYVRDVPTGGHIDRSKHVGSGYSGPQIDDMAELARKENVIIGARTTNIDSMRHIRDGTAVPKPVDIKAKTINAADVFLGANPADKGLVGYFRPQRPDPVAVAAAGGDWDEVWERYEERSKEFVGKRDSVQDLVTRGKVVEKEGKLFAVVENADGTRAHKPFAGDIDAVYFREGSPPYDFIGPGERYEKLKKQWMGLDKPKKPYSFLERFKRAWSGEKDPPNYWERSGAPGQHGNEFNAVPDMEAAGLPHTKAKEIQKGLGENHWKKGEVVMEMGSDGNLRRGIRFTEDMPLPDLGDPEVLNRINANNRAAYEARGNRGTGPIREVDASVPGGNVANDVPGATRRAEGPSPDDIPGATRQVDGPPTGADDVPGATRTVEGPIPDAEGVPGITRKVEGPSAGGVGLDDVPGETRKISGGATVADDVPGVTRKIEKGADTARAIDNAKDGSRAIGSLDDVLGAAAAGRVRQGLQAAGETAEFLGKAANAIDIIQAAIKMKDYVGFIWRATDDSITDEEADALFRQAWDTALDLSQTAALGAWMEKDPRVAIGYLLTCEAGRWIATDVKTGDVIERPAKEESCYSRHANAWEQFASTVSGARAAQEAALEEQCQQFVAAVKNGILRPVGSFKVVDVCNNIKRGVPTLGMFEPVPRPVVQLPPEIDQADPIERVDPEEERLTEIVRLSRKPDGVDQALAAVDGALASLESAGAACTAAEKAIVPSGEIARMGADMGARFGDLMRKYAADLKGDELARTQLESDLRSAQAAVSRATEIAKGHADLACDMADESANNAKFGADAVKQSEKARNLAALVDAVVSREQDDFRALQKQVRDNGRYPSDDALKTLMVTQFINPIDMRCAAITNSIRAEENALFAKGAASEQVARRFAIAHQVIANAKVRDGLTPEIIAAEFRLASYRQRIAHKNAALGTCFNDLPQRVGEACTRHGVRNFAQQYEALNAAFGAFGARRDSMRDQLDDFESLMGSLQEAAREAGEYHEKAKACAKRSKKPEEKEEPEKPEEVAKADPKPEPEQSRDCKPKVANKSDGGLDEGFIGQETFKEHQGDDCEPPKTVYQYEPTIESGNPNDDPAPELTRCAALDARVDDASSQFQEGRIKDAHNALGAVISDIAALPGAGACAAVKKRATGNQAKIGQLVDVMGGIKNALTACEPGAIGQNVSLLKNASNVRLVALRNRMERSVGVAETYTDAKEAFRKGDMEGSESLFRQALARDQEADGRTCKDIAIRINANIKRIVDIKEIADIGIRAADSCDISGIEGVIEKVKGATNPFLDKLYDRLEGVPKKCERKFAHDSCKSAFGAHAIMNESVGRQADGSYQCQCANGYKWKPGAEGKDRACISATQADKLAKQQANKLCAEWNGWGYYASVSKKDGSFVCIETKKKANQLCRDANPGMKVRAGKRLANGQWTCHYVNPPVAKRKAPPQRRQAVTRRQPQQRQVYRQPQYDPQAAARVLQGLQQIQRGIEGIQRQRGGGGGYRPPTYSCQNPQGAILGRNAYCQ